MKKKDLKAKIADLEARITDLEHQLENAQQYAEIMRGYQVPYPVAPQTPPPFVAPGMPGYMPAGNPFFRWTAEPGSTADGFVLGWRRALAVD